MTTSVVSKDYLNFQKEIMKLQERWKNAIDKNLVEAEFDQATIAAGVPIASLSKIHFDIALLQQWVDELGEVLMKSNKTLAEPIAKVVTLIDEKTGVNWLEQAFALNDVYFHEFAKQHQLPEWLPQFIAETALRPYLQVLAEKAQPKFNHEFRAVPGCGCPVCGEPVRLGLIEGKGQKVLHCPRCLAFWLDKKISCAHCGNNDHETIQFLTIEGDSSAQIHVCNKCNGYTKVIDTRQHISKPSIPLLDIKTIHLDYIAQEKGYSVTGDNGQVN